MSSVGRLSLSLELSTRVTALTVESTARSCEPVSAAAPVSAQLLTTPARGHVDSAWLTHPQSPPKSCTGCPLQAGTALGIGVHPRPQ